MSHGDKNERYRKKEIDNLLNTIKKSHSLMRLKSKIDDDLVVMKRCDKDAASMFIQARVLSYRQIIFVNDCLQSVK